MNNSKIIKLKDSNGNYLYPKIVSESIDTGTIGTDHIINNAITEQKLAETIITKLNSIPTSDSLSSLQTAVTTLNGDSSVIGSVDKKIADAISSLVGSAPNTLNTLQKIAEEMQNPANNTATTVLDQVANKADSSALITEISRAKKAEQDISVTVNNLVSQSIHYKVIS
nr:MAG TPA: hypothetical protein [Crassvirales sp.]